MEAIYKTFFEPLLKDDEDKILQLRQSMLLRKGIRYFDFTASGLASKIINKRLKSFLPYYANTHSLASTNAIITTQMYQMAKEKIREALGLEKDFVILSVGSGATAAIKMFQEIMGIYIPPKTKQRIPLSLLQDLPQVFVGPYEHHSNEISFREGLCQTTRIPLNNAGLFDLESLKTQVAHAHNLLIGSFNLASNVTGLITPYEEVSEILRQKGGIIAFDMASSAPYMNIPSHLFDACYVSPHKFLGGIGSCGILAIREKLVDTDLPPTFAGGGTIKNSNRLIHSYLEDIGQRQEAGTPPVLQTLIASLSFALRNEVGLGLIAQREHILTQSLIYELKQIPATTIYGNLDVRRLGAVAFNVGGIHPHTLAEELSVKYGIQVRSGCSCAGPYGCDLFGLNDELKDKPNWLRVSVHYTHTLADIEYFVESLKKAIKSLRG
ncbi:hypothetical protein BBW65_07380 [Helicobacter enhydrae]|uniref:Aminotransferase class V domain-containing protein n=1 Tax=Helicobacter enhydrae TaxID=222136 RepID=A0A1B1U780_9HELI|nr:hypothetical protein BBW65_07380 [Helicobacter enhydrae]